MIAPAASTATFAPARPAPRVLDDANRALIEQWDDTQTRCDKLVDDERSCRMVAKNAGRFVMAEAPLAATAAALILHAGDPSGALAVTALGAATGLLGLLVRGVCKQGATNAAQGLATATRERTDLEGRLQSLEQTQRQRADNTLRADIQAGGADADLDSRANHYAMRLLTEVERDPVVARLGWAGQKLDDRVQRLEATTHAPASTVVTLEAERAAVHWESTSRLVACGIGLAGLGTFALTKLIVSAFAPASVAAVAGGVLGVGLALVLREKVGGQATAALTAHEVRKSLRQDIAQLRPRAESASTAVAQERAQVMARVQGILRHVPSTPKVSSDGASAAPAVSLQPAQVVINGVTVSRRQS